MPGFLAHFALSLVRCSSRVFLNLLTNSWSSITGWLSEAAADAERSGTPVGVLRSISAEAACLAPTPLIADVPSWLGAHQRALAEGNDEARAVALADQVVIDAPELA